MGSVLKIDFNLMETNVIDALFSRKGQQNKYKYSAYKASTNKHIIIFTKEGLGIRSTARILKISSTTLLKRIVSIPPLPRESLRVDVLHLRDFDYI